MYNSVISSWLRFIKAFKQLRALILAIGLLLQCKYKKYGK